MKNKITKRIKTCILLAASLFFIATPIDAEAAVTLGSGTSTHTHTSACNYHTHSSSCYHTHSSSCYKNYVRMTSSSGITYDSCGCSHQSYTWHCDYCGNSWSSETNNSGGCREGHSLSDSGSSRCHNNVLICNKSTSTLQCGKQGGYNCGIETSETHTLISDKDLTSGQLSYSLTISSTGKTTLNESTPYLFTFENEDGQTYTQSSTDETFTLNTTMGNSGTLIVEVLQKTDTTVQLYSGTVLMGYTINYDLNGGVDSGNPTNYTETTETFTLLPPTRVGYDFIGWTGSNGTTPEETVTIEKGSTGTKNFTANWEPRTDTRYVINHYTQNLVVGSYTQRDSEEKTGTSDAAVIVSNEKKEIEGFTYSYGKVSGAETDITTIAADGSRIINLYYTRNSYTVGLTAGTGISAVSGSGTYRYEADVEINATVKPGYTWAGWEGIYNYENENTIFTMPSKSIELTATATANTDTPYVVRHWKQNLDGSDEQTAENYTLADTDNLEGTTDTSVTPDVKIYEGFASPSTVTVNVDGDGSLVVDYYYTRNSYTVNLTAGSGISSVGGDGTYRYGAEVEMSAELITEPPYQFVKWEGTEGYESTEIQRTITMPAHDINLTAIAKLVSCDSFEAVYTTPVEVGREVHISDIHVTATYSNGTTADITGNSSLLFVDTNGNRVTTIVKKEAGTFPLDVLYLFNGFETYGTVDVTFTDTIAPVIESVVYDNHWTKELPVTYTVSDNSSGPLYYFLAYERQYTEEQLAAETMQSMNPGEMTLPLHDNGDYYFYVKDPSGNMTWRQITISCIDDVPPVVKTWIKYQENGEEKKILPEEQTLGSIQFITFEIEAQDAETSVKQYRYKETNGNWTEWQESNIFSDIYMNGTYVFEAEDMCGNIGSVTAKITMLSQEFEVHYLDVDQNGTILNDTIRKRTLNSSVSGAELGTQTETGAYYEGYDYISCDTAVVQSNGATVHRYFKIHEYTVNYHDESGNIIASEKVPYGNTSSMNQSMEKKGYEAEEGTYSYIFKGWGTKDGTLMNATEVKRDMELYPVFEMVFTETVQQSEELFVQETEMSFDYQTELENLDITAVGTDPEYIEQSYETTQKITEQTAEQEQIDVTFISDEKTALGKLFDTLNDPEMQKIAQTTMAVTGTAIGITLLSALMQIFTGAGLLQSIIFGYILLRKKVRYVRGAWMLSEEGVKYVDKYGRKLEVEDNGKQTIFKRKGKILCAVNVEELVARLQTGRISYSQFEEKIAKSEVYTAFSKDVGIEVYNVKAQSGQTRKKMVGFNLSGNIKNMMKGLGEYTVRINNSGKQIVFDINYAIQNV